MSDSENGHSCCMVRRKSRALQMSLLSLAHHWSADVRSGHAGDVRAHDGRSNADVSHFRRKDFVAEDVDHRVGNTDQRLAKY